MPRITNCTGCGELYEESSEEDANDPFRLCAHCRRALAGEAPNTDPEPDQETMTMTVLELRTLLAGIIAAGYRAAEGDPETGPEPLGSVELARLSLQDASAIMRIAEERATTDDNAPFRVEPRG